MENTVCSLSCEPELISREIEVLGNKLPIKAYMCARDGQHYKLKEETVKIQLTICPTMVCNGHCRFCVAGGSHDEGQRIDIRKLELVLWRLKQQNIVRGLSFSGGVPHGGGTERDCAYCLLSCGIIEVFCTHKKEGEGVPCSTVAHTMAALVKGNCTQRGGRNLDTVNGILDRA